MDLGLLTVMNEVCLYCNMVSKPKREAGCLFSHLYYSVRKQTNKKESEGKKKERYEIRKK